MTRQIPTFREFDNNAIGFEQLFNRLNRSFDNSAAGYPPYNLIQSTDDKFLIEVAVAGFSKDELNVTLENNQLTITGGEFDKEKGEWKEWNNSEVDYIHKGISSRKFQREFSLGEYVEVTDVALRDGLLVVNLERIVPDSAKPTQLTIS